MNKKTQKLEAEQNRKKYKIPGGANYQLRTRNAIHISPSNSLRHELIKCIAAYQLRKFGEVKIGIDIIDTVRVLDKEFRVLTEDWLKQKVDFITEAVPKQEPDRRVDLVRLQDDTRFEFETNPKIKKEGAITIYI